MKNIPRRDFLKSAAVLTLGTLGISGQRLFSIETFKRTGKSRLLPSLAAYSFRDYFIHGGSKKQIPEDKRIDLFKFIDMCTDYGCVGTELTSYYFPPDTDKDFLLKIKRYAFLKGINISGTAVGNTFTHPEGEARNKEIAHVKKWIEFAAIMGAPHIRVFAGNAGNLSYNEAKSNCIKALEECAEYAGKYGIFLGLENHGGIVAEPQQILDIIKEVKSPWVGINLDTGNFRTDDPYKDLELCAPYAVNVQIKVEIRRRNQNKSEPTDFSRIIKILRNANYQGYVALEYEAAEDPWIAVPRYMNEIVKLCAS